MICACYPNYPHPKEGEAQVNVLDVGQGLAVFIQTTHHYLLYDTGIKFYNGSDMGKLAIIPYLKTQGIRVLDKVVISHPDLDHYGGLSSIEEQFPIKALLVNDVSFYQRGINCHHYPEWQWDGVVFRFLPIPPIFNNKNDNSCVLQIITAGAQLLLPGDIEKKGENYLVATYPDKLHSTILIAAHHGSKTSSSPAFLQHVAPHYAIISAGFDNRYHFPHQQTLNAFTNRGIQIINTIPLRDGEFFIISSSSITSLLVLGKKMA